MQGWTVPTGNAHLIRVDPGEDVLQTVRAYCEQESLRSALVVNGYGTLARWSLHWVTHNRIPTQNRFGHSEGGIEILGISGLIVDGNPHMHVALATPQGAFGGHVEEGCVAYVICEIVLMALEVTLRREPVEVEIPAMGCGTISRLFVKEPS